MHRRSSLASALALTTVLTAAGGTGAQVDPLSIRIHAGDCGDPGAVVAVLDGASADADLGAAISSAVRSIEDALGTPATVSSATLPVALTDLVAQGHAFIVDSGAGEPGLPAACGELGGLEPSSADIQVGLGAVGGAVGGVAWLHDNGDGTTTVAVVVATSAEAQIPVAIRGSFYLPDPLEITSGTTVSWTNEDLTPHTATATEGTFDSAFMAQGDTFAFTFETPGTFDYFCAFHPRMRATVIVR